MGAKVKVRLFHELRSNVGGSDVELEANSLTEMLQSLTDKHVGLRELLLDSKGNIRHHILLYVNNVVQNPLDLSRKLRDGDLILLIPPAAGG
jgi:molybdopterin converting factor small subunit